MKKILIFVLVLIVLGGAGYVLYRHNQRAVQMEDCLASNPLFYVKFSDVENNVGKFLQTNLWKQLTQINYDLLIEKSAFAPAQKASASLVKKQITDPNLWNVLNKFLGREFALAVYPVAGNLLTNESQIVSELSSSFVLMTRIESDLKVAEFAARSFKDLGPNITNETIKYKNQTIQIFNLSDAGIKIGLVRLGDILVAGIGDKMVKQAVDVYNHQKSSLTADADFKKVQSGFDVSSSVSGFWNMELFFKIIKDQFAGTGSHTSAGQQQLNDFFRSVKGLKSLGFSAVQKDFLTLKWDLYTNYQDMDPRTSKFYTTCSPKENVSIRFVPQDAIGYGWGTCVNLANYWDELQSEVQKIDQQSGKGQGAKNIEQFEQVTGLDIEKDVIAAFGNEMGGYITDITIPENTGTFPSPKLLFFVEYGDKSKMDLLLGKLKGNPLINLKEEDYKGTSIKYISIPTENPVEPGYCYLDKYLLVAFDKMLLKKSIDAFADQSQSLLNQPYFKKLGSQLVSPTTSIQFAKLDEFVQLIEKLIQWTENWADQEKEKRQAFKLGTKRRLSDVSYQLDSNQESLKKLKDQVETAKSQVQQAQASNADATSYQTELTSLEAQIAAMEKDIQAEVEQKSELEATINKYEKDESSDLEEKQFMLDKMVMPVLEAFKSIRLLGGFSTLENQILSTTIKLEIQ